MKLIVLLIVLVWVAGVNSIPQASRGPFKKMADKAVHLQDFGAYSGAGREGDATPPKNPLLYSKPTPDQDTSGDDATPPKTPLLYSNLALVQDTDVRTPTNSLVKKSSSVGPSRNTAECDCGLSMVDRIVNGWEVLPAHKLPWQVGLRDTSSSNYWCGASIINDRYVLTAAHCVVGKYHQTQDPNNLIVVIGDHRMSSTDDDTTDTQELGIERIIVHPHYSTATYDNDIALLKLDTVLELGTSNIVGSVCLPKDDHNAFVYNFGVASGWGNTQMDGYQPDVLQEMYLPILDSECWGLRHEVTENMLCVFPVYGDTCQGDSGGPLVVYEGPYYTLVGITSFTFGHCNSKGYPTVFTRVSKYLNWIYSNTEDGKYC